MKSKFKFSRLLALSALLIAGCAAYYSVFGLSQLFAGASLAVIIMASCLEFSKIVAVSFLQRYWSKVSRGLRTYLTIGVIVLVVITSAGIYGFLSNAYQKTAIKLESFEGKVSILDNKKTLFLKGVSDNQKIIDNKNKRIETLTDLRATQESRIDLATTSRSRDKVRNDISEASKEIQKLTNDIDTLNKKNEVLSDSANVYATKALESKGNNSIVGEVGPLKYLAKLTGIPMDKVVNYFILLLIFVFDPLAVALVIATNKVMQLETEPEENKPEPKPDEVFQLKTEPEESKPEITEEPKSKSIEPDLIEINSDLASDTETVLHNEIEDNLPQAEQTQELPIYKTDDIQKYEVGPKIKHEPVIPTGRIELNEIKEKKSERGFSVPVPPPNRSNIKSFK